MLQPIWWVSISRFISVTHSIRAAGGEIAGCIVLTAGLTPAHEVQHSRSCNSQLWTLISFQCIPIQTSFPLPETAWLVYGSWAIFKVAQKRFSPVYKKVHSFTNAQDETDTFKGVIETDKTAAMESLELPGSFTVYVGNLSPLFQKWGKYVF